jgi:hypothetical protein
VLCFSLPVGSGMCLSRAFSFHIPSGLWELQSLELSANRHLESPFFLYEGLIHQKVTPRHWAMKFCFQVIFSTLMLVNSLGITLVESCYKLVLNAWQLNLIGMLVHLLIFLKRYLSTLCTEVLVSSFQPQQMFAEANCNTFMFPFLFQLSGEPIICL